MGVFDKLKAIAMEPEAPKPSATTGVIQAGPANQPSGPAFSPSYSPLGGAIPGAASPASNFAPTGQPIIGLPGATIGATVGRLRDDLLDDVRKAVYGGTTTAYQRLKDTADKMVGAIPDEVQRLRAAVSVASLSYPELADALARHSEALHGKSQAIAARVQQFRATEVEAKQKQLADLNAQIASLITQRDALGMEVNNNDAKGAQIEADYAVAVQVVEQELQTATNTIKALFPTQTVVTG